VHCFRSVGEGLLREIFLKTDNALSGRYLAEITKEVSIHALGYFRVYHGVHMG
jgi:hypothetical protein